MTRQLWFGLGFIFLAAQSANAQVAIQPGIQPIRPIGRPIGRPFGGGGEILPPMPLDECLQKIKTKETRLHAVIALAEHGPKAEAALEPLLEALATKDEDLRLNAAITLAKIGAKAVGPVSKVGGGDDAEARFYAVWTLGLIGPDAASAAPVVVKALADKNDDVRRKAAYALGRIAPQASDAVPVLISALDDANEDVRSAAANAIAVFGDKAVPALVKVLETSASANAQNAAIRAIASIGSDAKEAIPALKGLLKKTSTNTATVTQALGKIGKASIPTLLERITGPDSQPQAIQESMAALGAMGADAAPNLIDLMGHKNIDIRRQATQALIPMRIGDKMVVLAFAYAVHDSDIQVRQAAMQGLQVLGPTAKLAGPKVADLLIDPDPNLRQQAFNLLNNIGEDPRPGLNKALASDNESIRIYTASLMVRVNVEREMALPILVTALDNKDSEIQIQAALTLAMTRQHQDKLIPILMGGLKNKNAGIRQASVQGIQYLGPQKTKDAIPTLIAMLEDKETTNVVQIVNLLQNLRPDPALVVPALTRLAKSSAPAPGVRNSVFHALAYIGGDGPDVLIGLYKDCKDPNEKNILMNTMAYGPHRAKIMPLLIDAVKDTNPDVRTHAMQMVGNMYQRTPESLAILSLGLKDPIAQVRMTASHGMNIFSGDPTLTAKAAVVIEEAMRAEKDVNVKRALVQSMINYGRRGKASVPLLIECLKDADPQIRWTAAQGLANQGADAKDAIPALEALREDANPTVRQVVQNVLQQLQRTNKQ